MAALPLILIVLIVATLLWAGRKLGRYKTYIVGLMLIHGALVLPFRCSFYGMENEDAYVYGASGRYYSLHGLSETTPSLTVAPTVGSLKKPVIDQTYSGHLITFPAFLGTIFQILGYSPTIVQLINALLSTLAILPLSVVAHYCWGSRTTSLTAAAFFSLSPAINVMHGTTFSEPFSSFFVIASILMTIPVLRYRKTGQSFYPWKTIVFWGILLCAVTLIKRDNLILLSIPAFLAVRKKSPTSIRIAAIVLGATIILIHWGLLATPGTISPELEEAQGFPFSFNNFQRLLPTFLMGIFDWKWTALLPYAVFLALMIVVRKRRRFAAMLALLVTGFVLMYCCHYRSYWFSQGEDAHAAGMLRYLTNFFPLLAVLASGCICFLHYRFLHLRRSTLVFGGALTVMLVFTFWMTLRLRSEWAQLEERFQTGGVKQILKHLPDNAIVFTDQGIIYQFLGPADLFTVNLNSFSRDLVQKGYVPEKRPWFFHCQQEMHGALYAKRWPSAVALANQFSKNGLVVARGNNWILYRISPKK
ncbi:MAG: hypothetical protein PHV34_11915 [Verrucomicrobiae bacterium]|nr:hypothetical protein [Verrucomicrobiae bacterium]